MSTGQPPSHSLHPRYPQLPHPGASWTHSPWWLALATYIACSRMNLPPPLALLNSATVVWRGGSREEIPVHSAYRENSCVRLLLYFLFLLPPSPFNHLHLQHHSFNHPPPSSLPSLCRSHLLPQPLLSLLPRTPSAGLTGRHLTLLPNRKETLNSSGLPYPRERFSPPLRSPASSQWGLTRSWALFE